MRLLRLKEPKKEVPKDPFKRPVKSGKTVTIDEWEGNAVDPWEADTALLAIWNEQHAADDFPAGPIDLEQWVDSWAFQEYMKDVPWHDVVIGP